MFLSAKYAYYNTGFHAHAGRRHGSGRGPQHLTTSVVRLDQSEPEHAPADDGQRRLQLVPERPGCDARREVRLRVAPGGRHDRHAVAGQRHSRVSSSRRRPSIAEVFRQGRGTNRAQYLDFYVGDTIARGRTTIDVGVRYDRQGGSALPSVTQANPAFPELWSRD